MATNLRHPLRHNCRSRHGVRCGMRPEEATVCDRTEPGAEPRGGLSWGLRSRMKGGKNEY